ncbi:MAG: hypothetical protein ACI3VU_07605 [Faecousia sp.]|nr:hypothetical protein [Bacillota bacterium]
MKDITFPASCAFAGVANMLSAFGVDAFGMTLPYIFTQKDAAHLGSHQN